MIDLAIIGAGPAGMTAALHAASAGVQSILIDSNPSPGRKLLVTGSGRGNLSNALADPARYTCNDPVWIRQVLARFGHVHLMAFLKDLGVLCEETTDGWTYPRSGSAATVVAAFISALERANIELQMETYVKDISLQGDHFLLKTAHGSLESRQLITAWGGKARAELGSDGSLFPTLQRLGHTVNPLVPALAPLRVELGEFHQLQGVRMDVHASLFEKNILLAETTGNLIVTEWGFNGPAVMDLSHHVSTRPNSALRLELDLFPHALPELLDLLDAKSGEPFSLKVLLGALLPPKVVSRLIRMANLRSDSQLNKIGRKEIIRVLNLGQHLSFPVLGVRDFRYCQLKAGGVPVNEVDPVTMASRKVPGMFLAGEVMDVVGPCGGYNLLFAFASGALAGQGVVASNNM